MASISTNFAGGAGAALSAGGAGAAQRNPHTAADGLKAGSFVHVAHSIQFPDVTNMDGKIVSIDQGKSTARVVVEGFLGQEYELPLQILESAPHRTMLHPTFEYKVQGEGRALPGCEDGGGSIFTTAQCLSRMERNRAYLDWMEDNNQMPGSVAAAAPPAVPPVASPAPVQFEIDSRVMIKGLSTEAFNGLCGTVIPATKEHKESNRVGVELDSTTNGLKQIAVKPDNLTMAE